MHRDYDRLARQNRQQAGGKLPGTWKTRAPGIAVWVSVHVPRGSDPLHGHRKINGLADEDMTCVLKELIGSGHEPGIADPAKVAWGFLLPDKTAA